MHVMAVKQMCPILVAQIQVVLAVKLVSPQDLLCGKWLSDFKTSGHLIKNLH